MHIGRGDHQANTKPREQVRTWRLTPLTIFLPSNAPLARLRSLLHALGVEDDGMTVEAPGQQSGNVNPKAIGFAAVVPGPDRLPGPKSVSRWRQPQPVFCRYRQ